jgi:transcriptional regulator with GAF, ATPase, and Fis domain
MAATTNKPVERACAYFEQSIKKLISQHSKYPSNARELENVCQGYVRHANHILRTLVAKRASLEYAIMAFEESSKHYVKEFAKLNKNQGDRQRIILTKWFTHFLRLRG